MYIYRLLKRLMRAMTISLLFTVSAAAADDPVFVRSQCVSLEIAPQYGLIACIADNKSGLSLRPLSSLAENYRLTLLDTDNKTATILGKDQKLTEWKQFGPSKVSLRWNGPLKDTDGRSHDIGIRMDISATDALTFDLRVDNNSDAKLREAWYPIIGGLSDFAAPGKECDATVWMPTSNPWEKPLELPFETTSIGYPGHANMSFACIQGKSAGRSVYFSSQDEVARYKSYRFMEIADKDAKDIALCIQHHPFTPPGSSFDGSPIVFRFIDGDWSSAGQIYRKWFEKSFGISKPDDCWIRGESFFLMTMFMLPEGTINYTFKDIPRWAKAAKEHGINAVQISGWQMGGHDNGYPYYIPDPRLGTMKELEAGIRECHKMGVKVYFFVNYQPMMTGSDWYKEELHKYREWSADGGFTWNAGWGMGTLSARMGNAKLMTWADLSFPRFRKIITDQFAALAKIGADGVHVDKMFPAAIDYNPDIPMSPDTATWEGAILLTKEIMAECKKYNPVWAMSFECNWDRVLQFSGSTWWVGNQLITRRIFPENAETLGLYQAYDYLGVNNAVRGGHHIMVAPLNFCRGLEWEPFQGLADYIKEVKRIRDSLQDTVFFGEALGKSDIEFTGDMPPGIDYNVFKNRRTGRRVCIFTNSGGEPLKVKIKAFKGGTGKSFRIHSPYNKTVVKKMPSEVAVPGERILFVEEMGGAK